MNQIFVDGLGDVTLVGGMVRLDFVTLAPAEKGAKGQPQVVLCQRTVMTLESFVRITEKMKESVQTLSKHLQARKSQSAQSAQPDDAQKVSGKTAKAADAPKPKPFP
jgi:hypothetical protein